MKQVRGSHIRAFKAEWIKVRRTGLIWTCIAAAAFIPLINTIVNFFIEIISEDRASGPDQSFSQMFIEACFRGFTGFFFPLFLIIMVTRIVYMEHRSDTWKLLETQPVTRFSIFISKWEIAVLISLLCLVLLFLFALGGSEIVYQFRYRKLVNENTIDWSQNINFLIRLWVASFGLISLQYFFSLIIKNFAWPVVIGIILLIAGSILTGFDLFYWFPYSAPSLTSSFIKGSSTGSFFIPHELLSIIWSLLFIFITYQIFLQKKLSRALFSPLGRLGITLVVILLFSLAFWYINKPSVLPEYGKTIFSGTIKSDKPVSKIKLLRLPDYDTIAVIPVVNGKFHSILKDDLKSELYIAQSGSSHLQVYFGKGDSIRVDWNVGRKNRKQPTISGTRIAENAFLFANQRDWELNFLAESASWYNAKQFSSRVMMYWKKRKDKIGDFKTVDNIKPRADFVQLQEKLLAVDLLTLTQIHYPRTFAIYYPNDTLKYSPDLKQLENLIGFNEEGLVSYPSYRQYASTLIQKKAFITGTPYVTLLNTEVRSEKIRNHLALDAIQKNLASIRDSARRWAMLQLSLPTITDDKLRTTLLEQNDRLNKLQRGRKAPDVFAENMKGTDVSLQQLANKYLIIDVWATWCGPCREEDPFFEQIAEQYTSDRIAFVSISVDQDKDAWKMQAPQKSKQILQLWAKNGGAEFMKDYSIGSIPRFILIDPKGYILNVQLPHPSDPQFEIELEKEIPILRANFRLPF